MFACYACGAFLSAQAESNQRTARGRGFVPLPLDSLPNRPKGAIPFWKSPSAADRSNTCSYLLLLLLFSPLSSDKHGGESGEQGPPRYGRGSESPFPQTSSEAQYNKSHWCKVLCQAFFQESLPPEAFERVTLIL